MFQVDDSFEKDVILVQTDVVPSKRVVSSIYIQYKKVYFMSYTP